MTILAEPPPIVTTAPCPAEPTPAASHHGHRSTTIHPVGPSRQYQPADAADINAPATTGSLLRHHDDPVTDHHDRARPRTPAASGCADPETVAFDRWPLYGTDPAWVDGYRLVSRLGAGGMADVFYAVAPTGTPVAVKILRAGGRATQTCQREYRLALAVDAHCTAPALGHGVSTAGAYLVTAYLPGYRSGATLVGRPTPAGQLWALGSALARVLAAVHARGVVHCDVKPSNPLVRGHDVRLIDFGIARYVGERCGDDGIVECSRGWAAPEQLRAAPAMPAVDVFAWGCLLAYLAGGVHPFASQGEPEWILRVQSAEPDLVGVPPALDELIRQTLARDPRDRPSAHELATTCRAQGDARPRPVPRPRLAAPVAVRRRWLPTRLTSVLHRCLRRLPRILRDRLPQVVGGPPSQNTLRRGRRR